MYFTFRNFNVLSVLYVCMLLCLSVCLSLLYHFYQFITFHWACCLK